jgi:cation diffusion facilitator CzcD-associated flavoprotein CzcO
MRLPAGARVAVIGAGPGGLVAAKYALEAGFDVSVFEASDDLGGQWHTTASHSGVWPGMRTNTSRALTVFSDFAIPPGHEMHPRAEQIQSYLRSYAEATGVTRCIRFNSPVTSLDRGWKIDGEVFDGVIVASGRFHSPRWAPGIDRFGGELIHAYDYPGAEYFRGRRVLVYGNGISGHEIASDLATLTPVISAYRKPRYVLQKLVNGVPSDGQWYTHVGGLRRQHLDRSELSQALRERVLRLAGHPADFGAPSPDPDILVAGHSLCQDYLAQVRAGLITCRPGISAITDRRVSFSDGSTDSVDAIVCATGYDLDIQYLSDEIRALLGPSLRLHHRSLHPGLPGLGFVGLFPASGPYFPLLELQARWITNVFAGALPPPPEQEMLASVSADPPPLDSHDALALLLSESSGVSPDLRARPELLEPLLFGPMVPARYRLDGPGCLPDAVDIYRAQLDACPRAPVEPDDIASLPRLDLGDLAGALTAG